MCSGSGVAPSGSGFSTTCLVGVTGAGFLSIPGFRRLARRRSRHSKTHLLHQIVHVTKLSTDVIASSTSNSSIMLIVPCLFFFLLSCVFDRLSGLTDQKRLKPFWAVKPRGVSSCFTCDCLETRIGVSLVPFSSSFCCPKVLVSGGIVERWSRRKSIFFFQLGSFVVVVNRQCLCGRHDGGVGVLFWSVLVQTSFPTPRIS